MTRRHLFEKMMQAADLYGEPIPGKTLIEVIDNCSVLIENHCGVIEYCTQNISVKTKDGLIRVAGCNMTLIKMSGEILRIRGKINQITIQGKG